MTTEDDWVQVRAEPSVRDDAEKIADDLTRAGAVKFTKAQVLSAGLRIGVEAIKADPSILVPARTRKRVS